MQLFLWLKNSTICHIAKNIIVKQSASPREMATLTGAAADIFYYSEMSIFVPAYEFIACYTPNNSSCERSEQQPMGAHFEQTCRAWIRLLEKDRFHRQSHVPLPGFIYLLKFIYLLMR